LTINQPVNRLGQLEIQIGQAQSIVRGELKLQVGVAGGDVGVMVESLGYLCYLHEARHEVAKAVKRPRFHDAVSRGVPAPGGQAFQVALDLGGGKCTA
jgi:hypothetical protein